MLDSPNNSLDSSNTIAVGNDNDPGKDPLDKENLLKEKCIGQHL